MIFTNTIVEMVHAFRLKRGMHDGENCYIQSPLSFLSCRCNGNNDCVDASDEVNCDKISVLDTYLNEVPAPPLDKEELTDVTLNVDIIQAGFPLKCSCFLYVTETNWFAQ